MPETKKKLPVFGLEIEVSDVPIVKVDEQINKYTLEDGTVLRVKSVATSIMRIDGQFLPDGSPIYIVASTPVSSVESSKIRKEPDNKKVN